MHETHIDTGDKQILLLGTIQGFAPDGAAVAAAIDAFAPEGIALGIPPEDLEGLRLMAESEDVNSMIGPVGTKGDDFGGAPGMEAVFGMGEAHNEEEEEDETTPFIGLDPLQEHFLSMLGRFGATTIPSPDLQAAFEHADRLHLPLQALDLDDDAHADLYTQHVKLRHLVLHGRIQSKILEETFEQESAEGLAVAWDARLNRSKPLRAIEAARETYMATTLAAMDAGKWIAIVPIARMAGVAERLRS